MLAGHRAAPRGALVPGVVLVAVALLAGCGGSAADGDATPDRRAQAPTTSPASAAPDAPRFARYVAIGDSYTAAPGVPGDQSDDGCLRSSGNYPHRLAATLPVARLVDVSCSGADTTDVRGRQLGRFPPQLEAVTARTDLVTIGLGGNDEDLFRRMLGGCPREGTAPPEACFEALGVSASSVLDRIEDNLVRVVRDVRAKAPSARVLLVGYPRIVPSSGRCAATPFAGGERFAWRVNRGLTEAVRAAATTSGATYVDVWAASKGHDLCSDDPWINGLTGPGAAPFHPFAPEQARVAELVTQALDDAR